MANGSKALTTSSDETTIAEIYSNDVVFGIPYFQRAYKWDKGNIERFGNDLENLLDYEDTSHFLGAIIMFSKQTSPSDPKYYEVIDGQQRLTTSFLALTALAKSFIKHDMLTEALGLYQRYLVINRKTSYKTNSKLISCKEDRAAMNHVFHDLMSSSEFNHKVQDERCEYKTLPDTGNSNGTIWKNYQLLCNYFERQYEDGSKLEENGGENRLTTLYAKLVNSMSFVQIVVKDPTDGPKIFDSLNSKQKPITIGDLVRNEIFAKISNRDDSEIDDLDSKYWHPFYERFKQNDNESYDKVFEKYFFPYVLTLDNNIKKADAFNYLRKRWANISDPKKIIDDLEEYQDIFIDLTYGTCLLKCGKKLKEQIKTLAAIEAPTSVYPFLMQTIHARIKEEITETTAIEILERIESFLVRRAVCGYEPTGLHAAFKGLWKECEGNYTAKNVDAKLRTHSTVKWPDNDEFKKSLLERPLYSVRITPHILAEWNGALGGDVPKIESQQIEHVLPSQPEKTSQWCRDWTPAERKKKDCIGNLLPLSAALNKKIQNKDYSIKKKHYTADSALKAPRKFAQKYKQWTPKNFEARSKAIAEWAVGKWKY